MYALDEVTAEAAAFRAAFGRGEGFRPLYVKIKLLYGCNLRCGMCNHWRDARPRQLTTERLKAILAELGALGCRKVHFTGGEPALRPDLEEIVGAASAARIRPTLTTNATLLTRARARRLVEAGLRGVNVSLDSPVPEVHDQVRGVAGSWREAVEGMKNLRKEAPRGKLSLAINTVVTRINYSSLVGLPALAVKLGARALRLLPVDDHTGAGLRLGSDDLARYNQDVAPLLARRGLRAGLFRDEDEAYAFGRGAAALERAARGEYALGYYRERPCFAPTTHALIDHEGRVFVCCMARGAPLLGTVHDAPFAAAWNSPEFRGVRLAMRDGGRLPACARCDDFLDENRRLHGLVEGA